MGRNFTGLGKSQFLSALAGSGTEDFFFLFSWGRMGAPRCRVMTSLAVPPIVRRSREEYGGRARGFGGMAAKKQGDRGAKTPHSAAQIAMLG